MKYGQLIEYNVRNLFLQKSSSLLFVFKKALFEVKASGWHHLSFNMFWYPRVGHTIKTYCMKL